MAALHLPEPRNAGSQRVYRERGDPRASSESSIKVRPYFHIFSSIILYHKNYFTNHLFPYHRSSGGRSRRVTETVEVRRDRSRSPVRIVREEPRTTERIVVEEHRETRRDTASHGSSDDEVVVIEEHSPPRRDRSKRESREYRREGGYRTVDPLAYGGTVGGRSARSSRR